MIHGGVKLAGIWFRYIGMTLGVCISCAGLFSVPFGRTGSVAYAATNTTIDPVKATDALLGPLAQSGGFRGSVLLTSHGQILVDKEYGLANLFEDTANGPQTRYAIGSLTQGFVAVAVMQLVKDGKVSLDSSVAEYVQGPNQTGQNITVRELLTQTSGAPASPTAAATTPGTSFTYSPLNYVLLGKVVQSVTGETCATYIQDNILTPLGLKNTGFITTDMNSVANAATGYDLSNSVIYAVNYSAGPFADALGMYSTTEDLYKWDQALSTDKLLPPSYMKQIFTVNPVAMKSLGTIGYGFGWYLTPDNAVAVEQSLDTGYASFIDRDGQNDTTVIILSNDDYSPMQQIEGQLESIVTQAAAQGVTP